MSSKEKPPIPPKEKQSMPPKEKKLAKEKIKKMQTKAIDAGIKRKDEEGGNDAGQRQE